MTHITLYTDDDGDERGFEVRDHSGFRKWGKDIVCAAISTLSINTVNSIEKFTADKPRVDSDDDEVMISCIFDEKPSDDAKLLLRSFILGIGDVVDAHRKHASLETRRYKP